MTASFIEKLIQIKSIQEHLRQRLQTVPTSYMLQFPLHSLKILRKAQINQVQDVSQKVTMRRPYSITKAMDALFKYNGNRA